MRFAQDTVVSPERSRAEIEQLLKRYGATTFGYATSEKDAMVQFRHKDRIVRFQIPMPTDNDVAVTASGRQRNDRNYEAFRERAERQRWRALLLVIKAKLEAVDSGITSFETEFLAHIVMPDGKTVGSHILPAVAAAYASGKMPKGLLPAWEGE